MGTLNNDVHNTNISRKPHNNNNMFIIRPGIIM